MVNTATRHNSLIELFCKVGASLRAELVVTTRMLADNVWVVAVPGIIVGITAVHATETTDTSWIRLIIGLLWSILLAYVFESTNQAVGADEDRVNKPHRPIPRGLATPTGMWLRTCISSFVYIALGATGGAISFVASILYVALILWVYLLAPKTWYRFWKPVANGLVVICQVSGPWAIVGQYNLEIFYASLICACVYMLPGQIEDARDVEGDRQQGRTTFATIFGARAVARFFAFAISVVPFVGAAVMWRGDTPSALSLVLLSIVGLVSWTSAAFAIFAKSTIAYRQAFQLFSIVQILFTALYCTILW